MAKVLRDFPVFAFFFPFFPAAAAPAVSFVTK